LPAALKLFSGWATEAGNIDGVWGNGASFDNAIINTAYRVCGYSKPWGKNQDKCYSTIRALYPLSLDFQGVAHNAVDDAKHQARVLIAINKKYDLKLK
jgi:exodeoxyribonuclease VIII